MSWGEGRKLGCWGEGSKLGANWGEGSELGQGEQAGSKGSELGASLYVLIRLFCHHRWWRPQNLV